MSNTVLITGATGLLGRQVVRAFQEAEWRVVGTGFTRANPPSILKLDLGDEAAIHRAANRFPDKCEADPDGTRALNEQATHSLATATNTRGIVLIYISTDYVFPGVPGEAPYAATAPPRPPNLYGETKLGGERAVLSVTGSSHLGVILRVPVLYGETENNNNNNNNNNGESAINVLLDAVWKASSSSSQDADKDAGVTMDDWAIRHPTNTEDVARVIRDIAALYVSSEKKRKEGLPRILQFSAEDRYTKYQICEVLADIMGLSLEGMRADKQGGAGAGPGPKKSAVQRPYDCHLDTKELRELGIDVHTVGFKDWW
ncbi:MAG: hypothetical protein M1816_007674 [Peltula sp. TS41687]|nr:MAG: hypothetical protein M1816_007674 [Peltula sp. TS41687]